RAAGGAAGLSKTQGARFKALKSVEHLPRVGEPFARIRICRLTQPLNQVWMALSSQPFNSRRRPAIGPFGQIAGQHPVNNQAHRKDVRLERRSPNGLFWGNVTYRARPR